MLRCAAVILASQLLVYYGTRLMPARPPHMLATRLDDAIGAAPAWITIYFLAFADWMGCILAILAERRALARRFTLAYVLAMVMSGVIFVFYPCTMVRPEVPGSDIFSVLLQLLYRIDAPTHLFPSLHVLITYLCWRGIMGCRRLPKWFARVQLGILFCVCLSILFVKQHVLADIPSAILVGELALQLSRVLPDEAEISKEKE